jgi:hypothetical protein
MSRTSLDWVSLAPPFHAPSFFATEIGPGTLHTSLHLTDLQGNLLRLVSTTWHGGRILQLRVIFPTRSYLRRQTAHPTHRQCRTSTAGRYLMHNKTSKAHACTPRNTVGT